MFKLWMLSVYFFAALTAILYTLHLVQLTWGLLV